MQSRRTVKENELVLNNLLQNVPDLLSPFLHQSLRTLHVVCKLITDKAADDKGLEELHGHLLWKTTLRELQMRTDNNDAAARVVHALSKQVLTEAPLLPLQHIREAAQFSAVSGCEKSFPRTRRVVEQCIHCFL